MDFKIKCGTYCHFKGNNYTVYGSLTYDNIPYVLYQQQYDTNDFWLRPLSMFKENVEIAGQAVPRFKLVKRIKPEECISRLVSMIKKQNILIRNSETLQAFKIIFINSVTGDIKIAQFDSYSSYLSDTQLAHRMGYDLYNIDQKIYVNTTCFPLPENKQLEITYPDSADNVHDTKSIISEINPCSIDLHISDNFFAKESKGTIDIASGISLSAKASSLWHKVITHKVNGFESIVLRKGQAITTRTYEKIKLPSDCAGKIEIKSSYARLALSVTASDFCNPGWSGYFPLTIKNNGKHKIVIHPKEKMLQLILIPTDGNIVHEYKNHATFMNDDGTPNNFWNAQTVKNLQKEIHSDAISKFYNNVLLAIESMPNKSNNSNNIEGTQNRFKDTFLTYCEKKLKHKKYHNEDNVRTLLKEIWDSYKNSEYIKKELFGLPGKIISSVLLMLPSTLLTIVNLHAEKNLSVGVALFLTASLVLAVILNIGMAYISPKSFCTFEQLEFDKIFNKQ